MNLPKKTEKNLLGSQSYFMSLIWFETISLHREDRSTELENFIADGNIPI